MLFFIIVGIVNLSYASSPYAQLDTLFLKPTSINTFNPIIKNALIEALADLQAKISVLTLPLNRNVITYKELSHCTPQAVTRLSALDLMNSRDIEINAGHGIPLARFNYALFLEVNGKGCQKNPKLLATARPCDVEENHRPILGVLNVCLGDHWNGFKAVKDLLRHEILHSLGFGTLVPIQAFQKAPPPEKYLWRLKDSSQTATRYYLDFAQKALPVVQKHFGCAEMKGLEADGKSLIHLNEYIFGNELMTPKLTNGPNYFTEITASILEGTFIGQQQWYMVNRKAIAEENSLYWYGRKWGCSFVNKSCFEHVQSSSIGFPFCRSNQLSVNVCHKQRRFQSKCSWTSLNPSETADNGITPTPTLNAYTTGSSALYRFCPMNTDLISDRLFIDFNETLINC
ncbi:unnamed protein product [Auanema sp. JU1783]|nr:unnamed protein product [Auanema sp. JU1783]